MILKQCIEQFDDTPHALMYGVANILTMNSEDRDSLLDQFGFENKEDFVEEIVDSILVIQEKELDLELIKDGSTLILPYFKGSKESVFYHELNAFKEYVELDTIVSFIIDHLDGSYLYFFHEGNNIHNVFQYLHMINDNKKFEGETWFENTSWNDFKGRFEYLLETICLERTQIDSIIKRTGDLAEYLRESGKDKLLTKLYDSLFEIKDKENLIKAHAEIKNGLNETMANYKAAGHKVMRNLLQCIERCKKRAVYSENRLQYLSEKYAKVYQQLTEKVIGQDYAVNEFVQACFDAELYENDPDHPQAVFLFAGPPGVGKTYLAQSVADILKRPFKAFDMSAYSIEKSDLALLGVEIGFKNAVEGTLVGFVEDNPDAIILFDEIEKAHPDVTRLFLSVIEGARLENKFLASNTDFSKTILIFTTNAGKAIYEDNKRNLSVTPTEVIIKELQKERSSDGGKPKFPPELCSRFAGQHIVMFNHIGISDMLKLIISHMDKTCLDIEDKLKISVEYDKRLALLLLMHSGKIDVRVVTGKAQQFIKREIYELSRQLVKTKGKEEIKKIRLTIDDSRISGKARSFFSVADSEEALLAVVCDEKTKEKILDCRSERIRFIFIDSEEKLLECDPEDVTVFMIDPYYEIRRIDDHVLGLDDYDSVGLRVIKTLLKKKAAVPIILLETGKKISQTDKNTLYMQGVEDSVNLDERDPSLIIKEIVTEHILQEKCSAMLDRRKIFDFESLQEMPDKDGVVNIKFYDIITKDAINPEDQDLLINIEERPNVKFEDVIGADNAKAELQDFIKYLDDPRAYMKHALAAPKGILLYGPPGTGKTMLARAMAGETEAAFISISAAKLRSSGEESIERLFATARKYAPAIIFIDEVDAIAHRRTGSVISTYDESLLNMLLTQMDGFEQYKNKPVFVIAATNFSIETPENSMGGGLDPAFLRRFGNRILVDQPNKEEKLQFFSRRLMENGRAVLQNSVTEAGMRNVAERTPGESLAILENILELAFRNAARKGQVLNDDILDEAMEEYYFGEKRARDEKQAYRTAVHEASHAYIYSLSGKKPTYLTVISRGNFGGYMQKEDEENKVAISKEEYIWSIRTSLAGRIGEMVIFGDECAINTGAGSDLRKASAIAMNMLTGYGMQEGHLFCLSHEDLLRSNMMPQYIEKAEEILKQEEKVCFDLINKGKDRIIALAKALLEKNHLNQEEIAGILNDISYE